MTETEKAVIDAAKAYAFYRRNGWDADNLRIEILKAVMKLEGEERLDSIRPER